MSKMKIVWWILGIVLVIPVVIRVVYWAIKRITNAIKGTSE